MTEKLSSIMNNMSEAYVSEDPAEMIAEIDEELEELKNSPTLTDEEIDEILTELWTQSDELSCNLDRETAEPVEAYDC